MFVWITNCLAALSVSAVLIVILKKVSPAFALVDYPDLRKRHDGVVPLCGGIAIFATFTMVMLLRDRDSALPLNFWAGLLITLLVGVLDDRNELSAVKRLAAQFVVALILVNPLAGTAIVTGIALPPGLLNVSFPLLTLVAVLFIVGLINSWNMIDGVDGLAGGAAAVALFWLAVIAALKGAGELVLPMLVLLAAVCGFLAFNMRSPWVARAKIFLGDAGSTALGATIAFLVIALSILRRDRLSSPVVDCHCPGTGYAQPDRSPDACWSQSFGRGPLAPASSPPRPVNITSKDDNHHRCGICGLWRHWMCGHCHRFVEPSHDSGVAAAPHRSLRLCLHCK
ncbi:undecaprenyl/decaprenyl-phosphate alpha-N-acetylglucosaminyl 1-phosphate transferase [Phyllobacterium sp. A18/5-2]|uniref:MraY family glycosyltransferase n=1 Tax=Phyllobacterium sp. A18/5-2 TaxID=2978392 RepID=UPI0021CAC165|nr:MraY family glycosyltransferase [Phyllobacterium sp. A18/5-2]UXN65700.1 undecaprenyl/decaprenyl-phosphate alpha-N-acetylglucosaminyl 1-phosphate transferase [Phyllobacterium sp. A18/5-2]